MLELTLLSFFLSAIILFIYKYQKHIKLIKSSKDYKIALGIYNKMNYKTEIKISDYHYQFDLEGFKIGIDSGHIYVDDVELKITNDSIGCHWELLPDPGSNLLTKIVWKVEDIFTKDKREEEDLIKKDAYIKFNNSI